MEHRQLTKGRSFLRVRCKEQSRHPSFLRSTSGPYLVNPTLLAWQQHISEVLKRLQGRSIERLSSSQKEMNRHFMTMLRGVSTMTMLLNLHPCFLTCSLHSPLQGGCIHHSQCLELSCCPSVESVSYLIPRRLSDHSFLMAPLPTPILSSLPRSLCHFLFPETTLFFL